MTLEELLEREGLGEDVDALVAWAHRRAQALAQGLETDPELGPLLAGAPLVHRSNGVSHSGPAPAHAEVEPAPVRDSVVIPRESVDDAEPAEASAPVATAEAPGVSHESVSEERPPPLRAEAPVTEDEVEQQREPSRAQPLPPIPTAESRVEVVSATADDAEELEELDELELLDEDDLELVEEDDEDASASDEDRIAAASEGDEPEWKTALTSAQTGDDSGLLNLRQK